MRHHLAALLAAAALVTLANSSSAPVSAADAKSEALSIINDVRDSLDDLAARAKAAAKRAGELSVSGTTRNRDIVETELEALADDLAELDVTLRTLDLRVSSLSATSTKKTTTATSTSTKTTASSSGGLRVVCEVSDRTVGVGESVTYEAVVSGGTKPYTYAWTGSFKGNGSTQKASFADAGTFREKITVTDKGRKVASDDCPVVDVDEGFDDGVDDDKATRAKNPKISLILPKSNARLTAGTAGTFEWKATGLASNDQLDIFLVGEKTFYYVATSLEKGTSGSGSGSYVWPSIGALASDFVPYGEYTLKVCTTDGEVCAATRVVIAKP
jgi:hypothetical protein